MILLEAFLGAPGSEIDDGPAAPDLRASRSATRRCPAAAGPVPGRAAGTSVSCPELLRAQGRGRRRPTPRTCAARARRSLRWAARSARTRTRSTTWRCSASMPGGDVPAIPPEMVFLPGAGTVQRLRHVQLVAHDLRPALDPLCAQAGRARCPPGAASASCSRSAGAPRTRRGEPGERCEQLEKAVLRASTALLKALRALPGADRLRQRARRARGGLDDRAVRGLRRPVRDPARDGQLGVGAQVSSDYATDHPLMREQLAAARRSAAGDASDGRAAHAAVPVAGLGHRARRPRARAGGARAPSIAACARAASWLLAKQTSRPGDWARRNPAPRRAAGTSSTATSSIPTSTTPAWR